MLKMKTKTNKEMHHQIFHLFDDLMFEELEVLNEVQLLRELPKLWLSRRRGGNSKWYNSSVCSENGGRARMPYVVGRSCGFLDSIIFRRLN